MSITYYICPYCRVVTLNSYMGREYRYCTQCGHTFDIDDTEAITVGQSQPEGHNTVASHPSTLADSGKCTKCTMSPSPSAVGPSTARSGGTS